MSFINYARSPNPGPGTFLAVAAYDGISAPFVHSLFASQAALADRRLDLEIFSGNCHVDDCRNRLVRDFLETDCEQLVFLDVDVFWLESDLRKLINHEADIVAGIYPLKSEDEDYPVKPLPGERWSGKDGLVEVEGVPTGFLKIRRRVLEALYPTVAQHRSKEDGHGRLLIPVIFERTLNGMSRRGGDIEFCRKAREAGFKVYVDPMMQLGHQGTKLWHGCLGHYWRRDVAIPEGLQAIREGTADAGTFLEMFNVWGNPTWSAPPELLYTATLLARHVKGPILDCGAGLSSLCLAAATAHSVHAIEQSAIWASKVEKLAKLNDLGNLLVNLSDVDSRWYTDVPDLPYALVICDGPAGDHQRAGLFHRSWVDGAVILVDDIARAYTRRAVDEYCEARGRTLEIMPAGRPFGIIR